MIGRQMLDSINPQIKVVQNEEPDGPTECIAVLNQDFKSLLWEALTNVPTYGAWLHGTDHASAYEYHRTVLQVLQSGGVRGRWSLKSPHHVLHLDALTAVYPDARIVVMHRDPLVLSAIGVQPHLHARRAPSPTPTTPPTSPSTGPTCSPGRSPR